MIKRGLYFHRAEALMREFVIMHWKKVIPFIIIIWSPFDYDNLVFGSNKPY